MNPTKETQRAIANPYVFVVGCPRSGTTLLQRMLDAHPEMTIANDTHFITRAAKKVLRHDPDPALSPELVEMVENYRRFYRMGLSAEQVHEAAGQSRSYSGFVARLYDTRASNEGKTISGEKTPDYCRQIPTLSRLFPASRFIHIVRDGRDTALSTLDWAHENKGPGKWALWQSDPVGTCALWWRWQVSKGCLEGRKIPSDHYHEIRYEDLVDDPDSKLNELAGFLGIPYSPSMSQFFRGKTRKKPGLSAKSAWIPPTKGLRDWRSQMSREDAVLFQELAGDWLERLGYEMIDTPQGLSPRAERCRTWWENRA